MVAPATAGGHVAPRHAKTATVAVNECRKYSPPTGPISPAAKNPAAGAPPMAFHHRLGIVVGGAEHPAPAAVAREHERSRRPAPVQYPQAVVEHGAQVLVGALRVAGV